MQNLAGLGDKSGGCGRKVAEPPPFFVSPPRTPTQIGLPVKANGLWGLVATVPCTTVPCATTFRVVIVPQSLRPWPLGPSFSPQPHLWQGHLLRFTQWSPLAPATKICSSGEGAPPGDSPRVVPQRPPSRVTNTSPQCHGPFGPCFCPGLSPEGVGKTPDRQKPLPRHGGRARGGRAPPMGQSVQPRLVFFSPCFAPDTHHRPHASLQNNRFHHTLACAGRRAGSQAARPLCVPAPSLCCDGPPPLPRPRGGQARNGRPGHGAQ